MRATDAWAVTIRARGRARRGAKMVVFDALAPRHPRPRAAAGCARGGAQSWLLSMERGSADIDAIRGPCVRYRSSSSGQSAPTAWLLWWPSRSAVDDPPDTRDQISSPRSAPASSARTGSGGPVPWPVRSCPSSSIGAVSPGRGWRPFGAVNSPWLGFPVTAISDALRDLGCAWHHASTPRTAGLAGRRRRSAVTGPGAAAATGAPAPAWRLLRATSSDVVDGRRAVAMVATQRSARTTRRACSWAAAQVRRGSR